MDIHDHNRRAWDRAAAAGERWSAPVSPEVIAAARRGDWAIRLTPDRDVPREWFGDLAGARVLGLASGGGQQCPVLAAAGARVVSFDASEGQLARDREVAEREGLELELVRGDMADLGVFEDGGFDLVWHPVSNVFAPDVLPVWRECQRVLRPGGRLLAGFMSPAYYLFDFERAMATGECVAIHPAPYSDLHSLDAAAREKLVAAGELLEYGHSLEDQIGGQLRAGFRLEAFFDDHWSGGPEALDALMPTSHATLARKPEAAT
ncbi:class I SAM-dependent methyltransferase [Engelhardtia mirabilis]|uniref:Glycine/sarcosine/dimethylglycine N-methyltransferase n=1 Tax=Engelhardtia mirabilis TaxID=2528011 RepID=A0A518BER6_9BACT|nr:Glycine/sarcosine/dimethylglycine N-methyltransferase [Planctomycetes bacterium Pla133]QDU99803.1 Glycine/sarcosine/dimethylglycine N-methyltransferase [Planctomycetes bacterium Pla86]